MAVTRYLNDPAVTSKRKDRVLQIHRLRLEMLELSGGKLEHPDKWAKMPAREDIISKAALLNRKLLARYRGHPHQSVTLEGVPVAVSPLTKGRSALMEYTAVWSLLKLPVEQWQRLRICKRLECGRWFHARFSHQNYCAETCRLRYYAKAAEWKEYRRRKALEYYHLHSKKQTK